MRRFLLITAVGTAAIGGVAVGGVAVAAQAAGDDGRAHHADRFTVVERATTDTVSDIGKKGDSLGDQLAFGNPVYTADNKTKIGHDLGGCVRTKVGVSWECSWTTVLPGGSITVAGPFFDAAASDLAIIGGTGRYATARGQMHLKARDAAGTAYDFGFDIIR
jgi:allene oxide cyclase